ncbi:MAG: ABC transporter permease [Anaerolineaceae bacterium]|nr:ABC transporter permease [Anaerolineaceae bacterium]
MSGNSALELVSESGWRRGLNNMLSSELTRWWKTPLWWVQSLIWCGITTLLLGIILFTSSTPPPSDEVAVLFSLIVGLFPSVGVIIIMQGALVGQKKDGTAAWIFSKPVTRSAFIMSKVIANSLGFLGTMVALPGIITYILNIIATGTFWNPLRFLASLCVIFLFNFFFMSLTLMLGSIFRSRGPVIGISLGLWLLQQNLVGMLPALRFVLPWNLIIPIGEQAEAVAPSVLVGSQNYTSSLILFVLLESILFILIGLFRFSREEF